MSNMGLHRKIIRRSAISKKKPVTTATSRVVHVSTDDGAVNNDDDQNSNNEGGILNGTEYSNGTDVPGTEEVRRSGQEYRTERYKFESFRVL